MTPALYAVAGKPILHSLSPALQMAGFAALGLRHVYSRLAVDSAREALDTGRVMGLAGLNITAPFKEEMYEAIEVRQADLRKLCAVNTVIFGPEITSGFNTDVYGVLQALRAHGLKLDGSQALVLGAGGAARAAVSALIEGGARVTVANRTMQKARVLAAEFGVSCAPLEAGALADEMRKISMVVSCVGAAERVLPSGLLRPQQVVMDAFYAEPSHLVKEARSVGCGLIDGREWLLYQGVRAFEHFTQCAAPVAEMRQALFRAAAPDLTRPVALIGFMGAGKSCVAQELGRSWSLPVVGLDEEIEQRLGIPIREYFTQQGEEAFRQVETEVLRDSVSRGRTVIACGGGVVSSEQNRALLRQCTCVWLWASPEVILERTAHDTGRPLLAVSGRKETVYSLLQRRLGLYAACADLIVNTDQRKPAEVAKRIAYEFGEAC